MFFDVDLRTGFHRRFFDIGELGGVKQEDWEVFWATHAKVIELARGGPDRRRARRPSRRARRPRASTSSGCADAGVEHVVGGEDRRAGRGAARLGDRGHDGLRVPERRDGAVRRRLGARSALHRALPRADRRHAPVRGHRARWRSSRSPSTSSSPSCAACTRRSRSTTFRSRSRRSTSTAPTSEPTKGVVDEADRDGDRPRERLGGAAPHPLPAGAAATTSS